MATKMHVPQDDRLRNMTVDEAVAAVTTMGDKGGTQIDWSALALAGKLPDNKLFTLGANVPKEVFEAAVRVVGVDGNIVAGKHGYPTLRQGPLGQAVSEQLFSAFVPQVNYAQWKADRDAAVSEARKAFGSALRGGSVRKSELKSLVERMLAANPELADDEAFSAMAELAS